jgi:WD40 repeat protein
MSHEHCRNFVSLAILVMIILLPDACAPPQRGQAQADKIAQLQIGKLDPRYRGDLALSPDGKTLALLMDKHGVELWDLGTGNRAVFPNPPGEDSGGGSATFSKSGRLLAVSYGHCITIWAVAEAKKTARIPNEGGGMPMVFTDADRTLLAEMLNQVGGERNPLNFHAVVIRWNAASGDLIRSVDFGSDYTFRAISPDGRHGVAAQGPEWTPGVYDLKTRARIFGLPRFGESTFWDDGSRIVHLAGSRLSIREIPSGRELKRLDVTPPPRSDDSRVLAVSSHANILAVGRYPESNLASIISMDSGKVLGTVECGPPLAICERVRLSTDGRILVTGTYGVNTHDQPDDPWLKIWRLPEKW